MDLFDLGERIREARKAQNMTQGQLSEASDVSRVTISQIEQGSVFDVKYNTLLKIMGAVGLTLKATTANSGMPVYEDIVEENEDDTPGLG
jgi:transcriptional regulator with XRE-family HTH domain